MNLYERTNQEENLKDLILKSETQFRKNSTINLFKAKYFYKTQNFQKAIDILENTEFHKNEIDRERSRLLFLGKCSTFQVITSKDSSKPSSGKS